MTYLKQKKSQQVLLQYFLFTLLLLLTYTLHAIAPKTQFKAPIGFSIKAKKIMKPNLFDSLRATSYLTNTEEQKSSKETTKYEPLLLDPLYLHGTAQKSTLKNFVSPPIATNALQDSHNQMLIPYNPCIAQKNHYLNPNNTLHHVKHPLNTKYSSLMPQQNQALFPFSGTHPFQPNYSYSMPQQSAFQTQVLEQPPINNTPLAYPTHATHYHFAPTIVQLNFYNVINLTTR